MHKIIRARNVQEAYRAGLSYIKKHGQLEESRNGPVYVAPGPVMTEYRRPLERVILDPGRDANPFFHLMEAMWMLAGREDVESISQYNSRMASYSDDGVTFNAPYGHRWRRRFDFDQIVHVVTQLRADATTRRAIIQMWDGHKDGRGVSKDFPCNTAVFFRARGRYPFHELDMTITNRSNDIIWGAYGANAVHMSVLHEFVAHQSGMDVGVMYQLSNNYHAYADILKKVGEPTTKDSKRYQRELTPTKLFRKISLSEGNNSQRALNAIECWWDYRTGDGLAHWQDVMSEQMTEDGVHVLNAMRDAWREWKKKGLETSERIFNALTVLDMAEDTDWAIACREWLQRRD